MWLLALVACDPKSTASGDTEDVVAESIVAVSASTTDLDFGPVPIGEAGTAQVTIYNDGTATFTLSDVAADSDDVDVSFTFVPVPPGGTAVVSLVWSPAQAGALDGLLRVRATDDLGASASVQVGLHGTAEGATLALSSEALDLGTLAVGCEAFEIVTLSNTGTSPRVVSSVAFRADVGLEVLAADGTALPAFPWTVEPGANASFALRYAPVEHEDLSDVLVILTDDPVRPEIQLPVTASARVEAANSITFDAVREQNVTVLIAVNSIITTGAFAGRMSDALYYFFDTLRNAEVPFRVGFLIDNTGAVYGDVRYVDETFTPDDAVLIAKEMYEDSAGDNDYLFQTLSAGIDTNREWLLDESDEWSEAMLNLVGVNNDVEQSTGNYVTWVDEYRAYKADPADIVVHGIGGDVPRGCSGADPAQAFYDAAAYTGGTFASICEKDWSTNMTELAYGCLGGRTEFALDGAPLTWSIEVYFDDSPQYTGWSYDADLGQVVFEDDAYPPLGTTVRIEYIYAPTCA